MTPLGVVRRRRVGVMTRRHLHSVGTGVMVGTTVIFAVLIAEGATRPQEIGEIPALGEYIRILAVYGVYGLVGGLLLRHSVRNPIGILIAVMGVVPLLGNLGEVIVARDFGSGLIAELATWIANWYFYAFLGAFLPLFHLLPTGTPMPGLWRWWARIAIVGYGLFVFVSMFGPPEKCSGCDGVNPFEIPVVTAAAPVLIGVMGVALVVGLATGVVSLGVRYFRSRGPVRAQLKGVFFGVLTAVALLVPRPSPRSWAGFPKRW
jgi:hypothetical protein